MITVNSIAPKTGILSITGLLLLTAACLQAQSPTRAAKSAAAQLPPLDPAIVALVETNRADSIEVRIHTISDADFTATQKAQALFHMMKGLGTSDQRKVALSAVKYTDDTSYVLIHDHLLDSKLDRQVLSVFMTHTLKRKNSIKLPMLLELAQINRHPLQQESQDLLRAFLQANHGTNWNKWQQAVATTIASNPN